MRNFSRTITWTFVGLFVLLIAAVMAARIGFNMYLNSDGFRQKIAAATGHALKADGQFMPLHLTGETIYTDGFDARGTDAAFFSELRADQVRADFNWHGLLHHAWQIDQIEIQRLEVKVADRAPAQHPRESGEKITQPVSSGWKLDLRQANVRDSRWSWGGANMLAGEVTGAALKLTPSGDAWFIDVDGGKIAQSGWPELQVESARLRYQPPSLYVTQSTLHSGGGSASVSGEIDFGQSADLQLHAEGLNVSPLLAADWRARLTGKIFADAKVHAPLGDADSTGLSVEGSARLADAQLTALPVLDEIATFTRTQRFRQLALSKASLDFSRSATTFSARNVVAESEGLLRVEGAFTVTGGQLDGTFQVGVTPASLQWLPGSQERVFTVSRDGYLWTPMRLSGPVDHPDEDLTPRLAAAAAGAVIKDVQGTVHDAAKGVLDLLLH